MDVIVKNLESDGEVRQFAGHGHAAVGNAGGLALMKGVFEPGWRWSSDVGPIAGTASCQTRHLGYVLSGRMAVQLDDGREIEIRAGDLFDLPAGHEAWVVGDTACEMIDYSAEVTRYARPKPAGQADDPAVDQVRRGYAAFNTGDLDTLREIFASDILQHVPGSGPLAGTYKGVDSVLGYYGRIGELSGGTFRADLVELHSDGRGHVLAIHQTSGTRNGDRLLSRGSILFTFLGDKVTDMLEFHGDLAGDDAFFED
jgi:ketosteroid isomerase-like protein